MSEKNDTNDDKTLFQQAIAGITPLKQDKVNITKASTSKNDASVHIRQTAAVSNTHYHEDCLSDDYIEMVQPLDILSYSVDGIQHGVLKKLRLGQYPIASHLDLHRYTVAEARKSVFIFIQKAFQKKHRVVLITHGKGEKSTPQAVLKSHVNHWLQQIKEVMAFHSATPEHGSSGSLYILLKKNNPNKTIQ